MPVAFYCTSRTSYEIVMNDGTASARTLAGILRKEMQGSFHDRNGIEAIQEMLFD